MKLPSEISITRRLSKIYTGMISQGLITTWFIYKKPFIAKHKITIP
jgi:hypothetical protein